MSRVVVVETMGPARPGLAIASFPQGIVAVGLRIAVIVLALVAFVTACVAVGTINAIDSEFRDKIIDEDEDNRLIDTLAGVDLPNTPGIVGGSRGACGSIIFLCLLALIYQPFIIILRYLNVGLVNLYINTMLGIDIVLSSLFAPGLLAGAISEAVWALGWWQWQEFIDDLEDEFGSDITDEIVDKFNLHFDRIVVAMGSSMIFAFLAMFVFITLAVWMSLFLVFRWNDNVVKYTTKGAALLT